MEVPLTEAVGTCPEVTALALEGLRRLTATRFLPGLAALSETPGGALFGALMLSRKVELYQSLHSPLTRLGCIQAEVSGSKTRPTVQPLRLAPSPLMQR